MDPSLLLSLLLLLLHQALQSVAIGQPAKNKHQEQENRIKPTNKKVKPQTPKLKDTSPKIRSIMTQVMDKGSFQKPTATLSLSAGQSLELRCKGNKIGWSYPSYLDTFKNSRLRIRQHKKYGQLILGNATAADTGEYSCWFMLCSGHNCKKEESKTGSTYIFFAGTCSYSEKVLGRGTMWDSPWERITLISRDVYGKWCLNLRVCQNTNMFQEQTTDKGELFVPAPSYFELVYLNPDKPAVIPCRVTNPLAKVSLHQEFPAEEIEVDGTNIFYDARKGFVYQHPNPDQKGIVYCRAESPGVLQISIKYHLLYVEVPHGPPAAAIKASSNHIEGGGDVTVSCTVLGEPEVEVEFNWIYPGQQYKRPVLIQDSWRLIDRGIGHTTRISESIITVQDLETIDAGNYICVAQNLRGQTKIATQIELI